MAREPGYCLHKPTGQAYVNLGGKVVYLGQHGTEESKRKYNQLKAEWLVNRHSPKYSPQPTGPTVADVCLAFLDHATEYYQQGTEAEQYRWAMKPISELYATLPANRYGVLEFRTVRDWWLKTPIDRSKVRKPAKPTGKTRPQKPKKPSEPKPPQFRSRVYINKVMKRVIRIFKWAAGEGMVPPAVHQGLSCVDPLKRGRTQAPDVAPITER